MITPDPEPMATLGTSPPFGWITFGLLWATLGKNPFGRITLELLWATLGTPPLLTDYFQKVQNKVL